MCCRSRFPGSPDLFKSTQKLSSLRQWMQNFIKIDEIMKKIVFEKFSMLPISLCMPTVSWTAGLGPILIHFTDQNGTKGGTPLKLNFEVFQKLKWTLQTIRVRKEDEKNMVAFFVLMSAKI